MGEGGGLWGGGVGLGWVGSGWFGLGWVVLVCNILDWSGGLGPVEVCNRSFDNAFSLQVLRIPCRNVGWLGVSMTHAHTSTERDPLKALPWPEATVKATLDKLHSSQAEEYSEAR